MKILYDFEYERPESMEVALGLLAKHGQNAGLLAGGTDLVVGMKYRSMLQLVGGAGTEDARFPSARFVSPMARPELVISLSRLDDLRGVVATGRTVRVGPLTTMVELAKNGDVGRHLTALKDAAAIMGSPIIRNRATFGGNLINARPAADTAVAAMALGATLELRRQKGIRVHDVDGFFLGPGKTIRTPEELLTGVDFQTGEHRGSAYERQGTRRQLEISLASAAVWVHLSPDNLAILDARISMGAVGPVPLLAEKAGALLKGKKPSSELYKQAGEQARGEAKPIDDYRGSADYRREIIEVLVVRALEKAVKRARGLGV